MEYRCRPNQEFHLQDYAFKSFSAHKINMETNLAEDVFAIQELSAISKELEEAEISHKHILEKNKNRFASLKKQKPTGTLLIDYSLSISDTPKEAKLSYDFIVGLNSYLQKKGGEFLGIFDKTSSSGARAPVVYNTHLTIGIIPKESGLIKKKDEKLILPLEKMVRCKNYQSSHFKDDMKIETIESGVYPFDIKFIGDEMHVNSYISWRGSRIEGYSVGKKDIITTNRNVYPSIPEDNLEKMFNLLSLSKM